MPDRDRSIQTNELQIDFFDILRDLLRDWWLILLVGLAAAMGTYMVSGILYQPAYTCRATFAVTSRGANNTYDNLTAAGTVADTLTNLFSSKIMKTKVAGDIGAVEIPDYISAQVIPETNLFVLTVSSPSPLTSYQIIRSLMKNYVSVTGTVYQNAILDVLEHPSIPLYPDNPENSASLMRTGFFIGMGAMAVLLGALSVMRDTVKNEKDVARKLDTVLFGTVSHEKKNKVMRLALRRKKKSILITSPTVSFTYLEDIKKLRAKLEYKTAAKECKVLLVTSVLENEGKSTVAANLALALTQKSKKVLLIDADFYKPSLYKLLQLEVSPNQEFGRYLKKELEFGDVFQIDMNTGLSLLLGSKLYGRSADLIAKETFYDTIEIEKNVMDYIIIDSPPLSVSVDAELLGDIADASLLVVKQSCAKTKYINDAIDTLTGLRSELLGCVFNNVYHGRPGRLPGYGHHYSYKGYYGYHHGRPVYQEGGWKAQG